MLKSLLREKFRDWTGEYWIHYSDVDYLKINPKNTRDVPGIYLFPYRYSIPKDSSESYLISHFSQKKYQLTVELSNNVKVFDLALVTYENVFDILDRMGMSSAKNNYNPNMAPALLLWIKLPKMEIPKRFKDIGYDAIFDDVISGNEIQLIVFDEKNLEIVKIEPNKLEK